MCEKYIMVRHVHFLIDLTTALEYVRNTSQLICTVRGGLVNSYTWTRYSVLISDSDPLFTQTLTIADRSSVTSELILSSANNSSLVGTYQCIVTDGNGRMAKASLQMNGKVLFYIQVEKSIYIMLIYFLEVNSTWYSKVSSILFSNCITFWLIVL